MNIYLQFLSLFTNTNGLSFTCQLLVFQELGTQQERAGLVSILVGDTHQYSRSCAEGLVLWCWEGELEQLHGIVEVRSEGSWWMPQVGEKAYM